MHSIHHEVEMLNRANNDEVKSGFLRSLRL
jgi:hypothetical protein